MTPAIFYVAEGFSSRGAKLMGRNMAGETYLRAVLDRVGNGRITVQVTSQADADALRTQLREWGSAATPHFVTRANLAELAGPGQLFLSGPGLADHARDRMLFGANRWSLCGITHTTATDRAMDAIADLIAAPLEPWDALICTSTAVRDNVVAILDAQARFLTDRFGASRMPLPRLPVIPLGVHSDDFLFTADDRAAARAALGLDKDTIVVLFVGRLSFHGKAHPGAMYVALERAISALTPGQRVILFEYGQFFNQAIGDAFAEGAKLLAPSIERRVLDGSDFALGRQAWAAGDVFVSLSDHIQEAFGITPVEAMAAGLPVVVSDWNGYKDTVRDGIDGFRVPTTMPAAGLGDNFAGRHALGLDSYDRYGGYVAATTAVDVAATAMALSRLFLDPELRRRMGASGRARARYSYDWRVVMDQHAALGAELAELREAAGPRSPTLPPARQDPFWLYAGYPTRTLTAASLLALDASDVARAVAHVAACRVTILYSYADAFLPPADELEAMIAGVADGPRTAGTLAALTSQPSRALRALGWLLKLGVLRIVAGA